MKTASSQRVERMFRALSDRTRLRILHMLSGGELCVCHIVDILGVPQPTASRHLAYLRKAGLVVGRKQQQWIYYRVAPARTAFHRHLLECLACSAREVEEAADDGRRLAVLRRCCG